MTTPITRDLLAALTAAGVHHTVVADLANDINRPPWLAWCDDQLHPEPEPEPERPEVVTLDVELEPVAPDEVADAEVIDDEASTAIQARIDDLTQEDRQDLGAWWKDQGYPPLKSGDVTAEQADAINTAIDTYNAGPGATKDRNGRMWALVAETGWDEADRDSFRRALITVVTEGRTESSKDLSGEEWSELFDGLEVIGSGSMELHQRGTGEWELRRATGGAS